MNKKPYLLSFVSGLIFPLALAPFNWAFFAYLSAGGLYYLLSENREKNNGRIGFCYGLGKYGLGVSWVFVSISNFSELHWLVSTLLTFGFISLLSLYELCFAKLFSIVKKQLSNFQTTFLFASLMTLCEILRSQLFSGFPWLLAGYSQLLTPLIKLSPLLGAYAVSFSCFLIAAFIANAFVIPQHKINKNYLYCFSVILPFILCQFLLPSNWTKPLTNKLSVSLLQGNIPHVDKWTETQLDSTISTYQKLTLQRIKDDLIVWPETALPMPNFYAIDIFTYLRKNALEHHSSVVLGAPGMNEDGSLSNSIFLLGENLGRYDKQHLVPFGEYMPIKFLHPLYRWFNVPFADLNTGNNRRDVFTIKKTKFVPFICFEIAFNEHTQLDRIKNANAILTITDDSWFGHSFAKAQHLQIAQMRSIETARPQLFASNDGLTAIINAKGKITKTIPQSVSGYLHGTVQGQSGNTPFVLFGNTPITMILLLIIIVLKLTPRRIRL